MPALSKLPTEVKGASYVAMWEALADAAAEGNGVEPAPDLPAPLDGGFVSRLSNLEVMAICRAWRRAAARTASRAGGVAGVDALEHFELLALAWREPGDKFQVFENNPGNPLLPFDASQLADAWATWARIAVELDDRGTKVLPLYLDTSKDGFRAGARESYARLLNDGQVAPAPTTPPAPAPAPIPAKKPPPEKSSGFPWLLAIAALLLFSRRNRR